MKRRIPIHLKALLVFLVAIFIYSVIVPLVSAAIPGQLYRWYVVATIAVILLYVSTSEAVWEEFVAPFRDLLLGRTAFTKPLRIVVFLFYHCSWAGIFPAGWRAGYNRRVACASFIPRLPPR